MKIIILHHELGVSLRYVVVKGKDTSKKMTLYDFFYFKTTKSLQTKKFMIFWWELDLLKEYFSIYN